MPSSSASSSDSDTSSPTHKTNHSDFSSSIFQSYFSHSNLDSSHNSHLIKIQSFLISSQSNALSCLICLEKIKPISPTWSCSSLCFTIFHLHCIQSWSNQSLSLSLSRATSRAPVLPDPNTLKWPCPKCRTEYSKLETPKNYFCFCGSVENPVLDPWILPHSCGEVCGRELRNKCGHFCLLLCHPGPCPPCPKMVKNRCFCGRVEDVRRCGFKDFTCGGVCSKVLRCGVHKCGEVCHDGECGECRVELDCECECGKVVVRRECWDREFRCEGVCGERLKCRKHVCERGCHKGECGECPRQGRRSCPCGKRVYDGMACDVDLPLCGGTCDKRLGCGFHRCPERCHRGECVGTCRSLVTKSCRCGSLKKQVPCYQELTCERKCQNVRDCGRHACKRKCCDGDCPPCSEICERRLRCRNHKCPAPCHRGACAPCPLMVTISCFCGETHFEVPCGTEGEQKPPKCPKQCHVAPLCTHRSNCKPHKCHYGACPPCRLTCSEEYPCGHNCKLRCHGPKPPPLPEFTLKPKKKRLNHQIEPTPGSSCPPCPELVVRSCVGQHVGVERMMVCSNKTQFSCDNLCGNPLPCGNHFCTYVCHALISRSSKSNATRSSDACEKCNLPCQKDRDPTCPHACPLPCHPGECPPCKTLVKRSCHCGAMVHVFECIYFNSMSEKEQMAARSCKGPCHRKLPYCTHLCPETCHPGPCPLPDKCSKKVHVRCRCQTIKKEWLCQDVQTAYRGAGSDPKDILKNQYGLGLIPCENDCKSKVKVPDSELHFRQTKPREEKESDNSSTANKRRRRKQRVQQNEDISRVQRIVAALKRILWVLVIVSVIISSSYFGFKGLMWLSDWMNKNEIGQKTRYKRI